MSKKFSILYRNVKIILASQIINVVQKRGIKPRISSSKNKISTTQTKSIFIKKPKSPRVNTFKGKVIIFKIGLRKKLNKPNINPTKIKICQLAVRAIPKNEFWSGIIFKETPGTNFVAKKIPMIPAMI